MPNSSSNSQIGAVPLVSFRNFNGLSHMVSYVDDKWGCSSKDKAVIIETDENGQVVCFLFFL